MHAAWVDLLFPLPGVLAQVPPQGPLHSGGNVNGSAVKLHPGSQVRFSWVNLPQPTTQELGERQEEISLVFSLLTFLNLLLPTPDVRVCLFLPFLPIPSETVSYTHLTLPTKA